MFDNKRAMYAIDFIQNLKHTKGKWAGVPFKLLPWQYEIIKDVFGTVDENGRRQYQYVYLEVPKKNGKSELAAAIALLMTYGDGEVNGEIYSCASDRSQASLVFDVAYDMMKQSPALTKRTKAQPSLKQMTDKTSGSTYKVVSAEAFTKHGLNVSCCIFDELHAQPNRDLWDVMTTGSGDARDEPLFFTITTAGNDVNRPQSGGKSTKKPVKSSAEKRKTPVGTAKFGALNPILTVIYGMRNCGTR